MRRFLLFCCATLVTGTIWGDIVNLNNGDRLSGDIQSLESGKLALSTSYAGTITVDWHAISSLTSANSYKVQLDTGQVLKGSLSSPGSQELQVGPSESQTVTFAQIRSIEEIQAPTAKPGVLQDWHGNADVGFTVTRGNSNVTNLSVSVRPERITDLTRIRASFHALYDMQNGSVASNRQVGRLRYDYFLGVNAFVFGVGSAEKDAQQLLRYRTSEGGGFGWHWGGQGVTQYSLFGGMTFMQEAYRSQLARRDAQGLLGADLNTTVLPGVDLSTSAQITPVVENGRYRIDWTANIQVPLMERFHLGFQIFDYFDSSPPEAGVKKNDFGTVWSLGYKF